MLPRLSGYELCRKIRSEGVTIPIVMLTARGERSGPRARSRSRRGRLHHQAVLDPRAAGAPARHSPARSTDREGSDELRFDDVVVDFRRYEARKGDARTRDDAQGVRPAPVRCAARRGRGRDA